MVELWQQSRQFTEKGDGDEDARRPTKRRRAPRQASRQFTEEEEDTLIEFWSSMLYDRRHNDFKRNDKRRRVIDSKAKKFISMTGKCGVYSGLVLRC